MKEQSTRQLKVGQEIKAIVSELFMRGDMYDPKTYRAINITISEVKVSPDMRNATIYFIPFGGKDEGASMVAALTPLAGKIKGIVGKKMRIRNIPSFIFRVDNSFDEAKKMSALLMKKTNDYNDGSEEE